MMHHSDRDVHRQGFECAPPIHRRAAPVPVKPRLPLGRVLVITAAVLYAVFFGLNP